MHSVLGHPSLGACGTSKDKRNQDCLYRRGDLQEAGKVDEKKISPSRKIQQQQHEKGLGGGYEDMY